MAGLMNPLPGHTVTQGFAGAYYMEQPGWLFTDAGGPWAGSKTSVTGPGWTYKVDLHMAIDQSAPIDTPVLAPERMKIVVNMVDPTTGDHFVIGEIRFGTILHFDHLSKVLLPVGTVVGKGVKFALSGATGHVSGPHLHWEVRHTNSTTADYRVTSRWRRYNPLRMYTGKDHANVPWIVPTH